MTNAVATEKLSLRTKLAYGVGDLGTGMTAAVMVFFLLIFLTEAAGLPPGMAGSILLIGKLWDAINDPIIGTLSDKTRSRWGRRHSWMLLGAIPFGISFFLCWLVPNFGSDSPWPRFWYYTVVLLLFHTFYSAVNLPYTALTPELTQDYNERTSLTSFRFAFSVGGSLVGLTLALIIFGQVSDVQMRYMILAGICAIVGVIPLFICVWGTEERYVSSTKHSSLSFIDQFKIVLKNRAFLFVIGIYLCSWLAFQLTAAVIPFYAVHWMSMENYVPIALIVQGVAIAMLFVWTPISRRQGKRAVYFMGMVIWTIAQGFLFFLAPGELGLLFLLCALAGFGVATAYLIPWSMLPDVIDLDELETGERREGVFYAFMILLQKLGLALGVFLVGQMLETFGFDREATTQPTSALLAIRVAIGPLPSGFLLVGMILAYFYPITRSRHAEILRDLAAKREAEAS